jgi:hypothetical protein
MAPLDDRTRPPRAAMAFHVGVTGHRALSGADIAGLKTEAVNRFRAIRAEVLSLHAADQASAVPLYVSSPPELRCVCGLAEGADSILAEAALAEGWRIVATLPFARDEFEKDFEPGPAREYFRTLLDRAAVVSELNGSRQRGGEPYAEVGEQIVEQSDLMLVVWDGLPPRGPGGTGDVVQRALQRSIPVAVLPRTGPVKTVWRGTRSSNETDMIRAVLLPQTDLLGFPQAYFREVPRQGRCAVAAVRWYEKAALVGIRSGSGVQPTIVPATAPSVAAAETKLLPYFLAADRLASGHAMHFRAAGLMRYGLILPATLGALLASSGNPQMRVAGLLLQFAALATVLAFLKVGGWERSQARYIAYRAVAEYLRNVRLLAPFGAVPQGPSAPPHQAKAVDWTAWYGRAVVRCTGLISGHLDAAAISAATAFLRAETRGQVAYLVDRAARFNALARRLKRIGVLLFASGITFEAARVALLVTGTEGTSVTWLSELSLVLPGLAPVFLGLLAFGEYSRLATRYQAVAAELKAELAELDQVDSGCRAVVLPVGRRIAEIMLAESVDWQLLIKARTLSAY